MKTLNLVGDNKFKIADTGTMMSYYATDNNSKVPFTKDDKIVFKIRNSDGYVMEVPGIVSGGGYWVNLDSSKLKSLPPATYEVEMWSTDKNGNTDIYPDDSFVPFTITNNATIVTSDSLPLISLDEYEAKLKAYCNSEVESAKSDIKTDFQKFIDGIQNNTIQQAQQAIQDATNAVNTANDASSKAQQAVSTANSMNGKITANSTLIQATNQALSTWNDTVWVGDLQNKQSDLDWNRIPQGVYPFNGWSANEQSMNNFPEFIRNHWGTIVVFKASKLFQTIITDDNLIHTRILSSDFNVISDWKLVGG